MTTDTEKLLKYTGEACPNCESEDINGGEFMPTGAKLAHRKIDCEDCGATWIEILTVDGFVDLEVPEKVKKNEKTKMDG